MTRMPQRLLACLLILALAGCNTPLRLPPLESERVPNAALDDRELNQLLAFYRGLEGRSEASLERERKFYKAASIDGRCDDARMRLALVLLRGVEAGQRVEGADSVLQPCLVDRELKDTNAQHLAYLIHAQLRSRTSEQSRYHTAIQDYEVLKRDNQELRRQVEGLKAIERSLQDRRRREQESSNGTAR